MCACVPQCCPGWGRVLGGLLRAWGCPLVFSRSSSSHGLFSRSPPSPWWVPSGILLNRAHTLGASLPVISGWPNCFPCLRCVWWKLDVLFSSKGVWAIPATKTGVLALGARSSSRFCFPLGEDPSPDKCVLPALSQVLLITFPKSAHTEPLRNAKNDPG